MTFDDTWAAMKMQKRMCSDFSKFGTLQKKEIKVAAAAQKITSKYIDDYFVSNESK